LTARGNHGGERKESYIRDGRGKVVFGGGVMLLWMPVGADSMKAAVVTSFTSRKDAAGRDWEVWGG